MLADFSGYIAVDELYDGPFCYLSIVDQHTQRRLFFELLDRAPTKDDIKDFLKRFRMQLALRALVLSGVTTDGSALYPEPLAEIFPGATHQICRFHLLKEILAAVLHALAKTRKELRGRIPKRTRGRPTAKQRELNRRIKRLEARHADLFEHRYLFVRRRLTDAESRTLERISRGFSGLRVLRGVVEEVYRLFDRRCGTKTAVAKVKALRRRVHRFKSLRQSLRKLDSPLLEKALRYLDDGMLLGTSNAVERGNRRHRKMQKSVYRVRRREHVHGRIAAC